MGIKPDWTEHLHAIRRRQFGAVFGRCPPRAFPEALELGAGDGFLSTLLAGCCGRLTASDLNAQRLRAVDTDNITYRVGDAEAVGELFPANQFDLVLSSSLLERAGFHASYAYVLAKPGRKPPAAQTLGPQSKEDRA
ncbi:MAG: class I SAM-dependent methyltransferase [Planctomycetota bacterium]|nr:class I SAM-dependent methyltransferase [Planctomycetota bacterium]